MISEIETEMVRARALVVALSLTNPASDDYRQWTMAPELSRVNLGVASVYDGNVLGVAKVFFAF